MSLKRDSSSYGFHRITVSVCINIAESEYNFWNSTFYDIMYHLIQIMMQIARETIMHFFK